MALIMAGMQKISKVKVFVNTDTVGDKMMKLARKLQQG
jgi:hypothetical protein